MAAPHNFQWIEASRLWLVLDLEAALPRSLTEATLLCIEGGVDVVVFRMKDATAEEALPLAREVREVCGQLETPFALAHFAELIEELRPDALHIGSSDAFDVPALRGDLPEHVALGYSTHSVAEAESVVGAGADYVFLGPVFPTPSKLHYGAPLGGKVVQAAQKTSAPVIYIGGMTEQTIPLAVQAGAKRVAAISALLSVPDPRDATRRLKALLPA